PSPSGTLEPPTLDNTPSDNDRIFPSLPPLLRGHAGVHLRDGIMKASKLANTNEPDAEKAFFVADLSRVYIQHQRWKKCLPDVQPFYGMGSLVHVDKCSLLTVRSDQVQP